MQTEPMALDALGGADAFAEFRVDAPREVSLLLKRLVDGNITLNLVASDGSSLNATLWSYDSERGTIGLHVDAADIALADVVEADEAVVVGYLDAIKVQFDAHDLVMVRGMHGHILNCSAPRVVYRFQRRNAYRVRPLPRATPVARLRHTELPDMALALRVIDVSIGGCALFLPENVPPLRPGVVVNRVEIELDADTRFTVDLRLQHVSSLGGEAKGVRLGCEFMRADPGAERSLQRYIDQTQKRGKLLSLG